MKKILYICVILCLIFCMIFLFLYYKNSFIGNNINRKFKYKNIEYILNNYINYEAEIDVTIFSNKNENNYKIKQVCSENKSYQNIQEPAEIKNMYINLENEKLTIGNMKLNLEKVYEKYNNILNNSLFLNVFIKEYIENESQNYEENGKIILETNLKDNFNTYVKIKKLYINKEINKPEKLEIYDDTKKLNVCIIYNYIEKK